MKNSNKTCGLILALTILAFGSGTVYADLNAWDIYNDFNSLNGGQGYRFTTSSDKDINGNAEFTLVTEQGFNDVDTTAYVLPYGGVSFFKTFCVEPNASTAGDLVGKLNYDNGTTATSQGFALTLGAAVLYKEYATGNRPTVSLETAIQTLMGIKYLTNWAANPHLLYLLAINSNKSYWTQVYDPGQYYDEIGDYSIFVMNVVTANNGDNRQDFLYIAETNSGGDVPEPTTILLWSLGGMGLAGISRMRKRRLSKSETA